MPVGALLYRGFAIKKSNIMISFKKVEFRDFKVRTCIFCAVVCVARLSVAMVKKSPMSFDWVSILVGILSLLVTALIGWQIFNFIYIKDEVKDQITNNVEKAFNDLTPILKGMMVLGDSKSFYNGNMTQALDDNMIALETIFLSENCKLIEAAVGVIMGNLYEIKKDMEGCERIEIFKDQKPRYAALLKKVDHCYAAELMSLLERATEVEYKRDNHMRLFNEGNDDLFKLKEKGVIG